MSKGNTRLIDATHSNTDLRVTNTIMIELRREKVSGEDLYHVVLKGSHSEISVPSPLINPVSYVGRNLLTRTASLRLIERSPEREDTR